MSGQAAFQVDHRDVVVRCVLAHPGLMSAYLLEFLLRGEAIARLTEKKLDSSPYFGALAGESATVVAGAIAQALETGLVKRHKGAYPALTATAAAVLDPAASSLLAPDASYQVYHAWRAMRARDLGNKAPDRVLVNRSLVALASMCPTTLEQLLTVPGLGVKRALRYQVELLAIGRTLTSTGEAARG